MGLANWLTILRIVLIPVFVTLLVYRKLGTALLVFGAAALTDLLDGWVARRQGLSSRLGAFLDPLADKLLLIASFVTLTWLKALPFWITAVVFSRDVMLIVGALLIHMVGGQGGYVLSDPDRARGALVPLLSDAPGHLGDRLGGRRLHDRFRPALHLAGRALPQRRRARGDG